MTTALLVSQVVLWVFLIGLGVVVLALARQLGLVLVRTGPLGGAAVTDEGPPIGSQISPLELEPLGGSLVRIPSKGRRTLLVFVSQSCSACADLLPALRTIAVSERSEIAVVLASVANASPLSPELLESLARIGVPYVTSPTLAEQMNVRGFPFAVVISSDGITQSKGIVNNVVQLESLLRPAELERRDLAQGSEPSTEGGFDVAVGS